MGSSQRRAIKNHRARLAQRGMTRFEVAGLTADRDLIRSLARRLAEHGPEAARLRAAVGQAISGEAPKKNTASSPRSVGLLWWAATSALFGPTREAERLSCDAVPS